jgi:hypothetical protein
VVEPPLSVGDAVGEPVERLLGVRGSGEEAVPPQLLLVAASGALVGSPGLGGCRRRGPSGVASPSIMGVGVIGDSPAVPAERVVHLGVVDAGGDRDDAIEAAG